jgi:hypothetical protein
LERSLRRSLVQSLYAGRNQIPLVTAAGRGTEADGGSARNSGWSEIHTLRIGSIRDKNNSNQAVSSIRDSNTDDSCKTRASCSQRSVSDKSNGSSGARKSSSAA